MPYATQGIQVHTSVNTNGESNRMVRKLREEKISFRNIRCVCVCVRMRWHAETVNKIFDMKKRMK